MLSFLSSAWILPLASRASSLGPQPALGYGYTQQTSMLPVPLIPNSGQSRILLGPSHKWCFAATQLRSSSACSYLQQRASGLAHDEHKHITKPDINACS